MFLIIKNFRLIVLVNWEVNFFISWVTFILISKNDFKNNMKWNRFVNGVAGLEWMQVILWVHLFKDGVQTTQFMSDGISNDLSAHASMIIPIPRHWKSLWPWHENNVLVVLQHRLIEQVGVIPKMLILVHHKRLRGEWTLEWAHESSDHGLVVHSKDLIFLNKCFESPHSKLGLLIKSRAAFGWGDFHDRKLIIVDIL